MKKIIVFLFLLIWLITFWDICNWENIKKLMLPEWSQEVITQTDIDWGSVIKDILLYVKETLSTLVIIFAIWAFMYVWFKLISARWNAEEFKKAMQSFIYTIVGIVLAGMAYAIVALISSY